MSEFTQHTLRRLTRDEYERTIANSFLVSADMARLLKKWTEKILRIIFRCPISDGVHPNYSSLHDRDHRPSLLNGGVVVKTNCCNRYATTAFTATVLKEIARSSNVPLQVRRISFRSKETKKNNEIFFPGILHEKWYALRNDGWTNFSIASRSLYSRCWRSATFDAFYPRNDVDFRFGSLLEIFSCKNRTLSDLSFWTRKLDSIYFFSLGFLRELQKSLRFNRTLISFLILKENKTKILATKNRWLISD